MTVRPDIGDQPTVTATFTVDGVPTSPSTVVAMVRRPNGTETALSAPVSLGTGVFKATLPVIDAAGTWACRMKGTAGVIAAVEVVFVVPASRFVAP